jgi:hypothetical protein
MLLMNGLIKEVNNARERERETYHYIERRHTCYLSMSLICTKSPVKEVAI